MRSAPGITLYRWLSLWLITLAALPFLAAPVAADSLANTVQVTGTAALPGGAIPYTVLDSNNSSAIIQDGEGDIADSEQTGNSDAALINQQGNNDASTIRQSSLGDNAVNTQVGSGLSMSISQTGPVQNIVVNQNSR